MKKHCLPFEDYSHNLKESYSNSYGCMIKEFVNSTNNNLIIEGSFNRLISQMQNKDFAIISAYRHEFDKPQNIKRNRKLRGVLNMKRLGVHQLVGHWREAPKGIPYNQAKESELTDVIERSYFVVKPDDMDYKTFKTIITKCLTIDNETQDSCIIHLNGGGYYCLYQDGSVDKIGDNLTLNKIGQAYSQYVKRLDIPFIFEGVEYPSSISGRRMFNQNGIEYTEMPLQSNKLVISESELKQVVEECTNRVLAELDLK